MSVSTGPRRTIGVICNADHDVFAAVADRLRRLGHRVVFFEPGRELSPADVEDLALLANKKVDPASFRALRYADRTGVPTWNGSATVVLGARLVAHSALGAVGCRTPPVSRERPERDYVAKTLFDWHFAPDPVLNGDGDLYQPLLPTDGVDFKYYAVDDGERVHLRVVRATSKLYGPKEPLGHAAAAPGPARAVRALLARTGSNALGVDFVRSGGEYYAVDVNPAMSFRHAGMEHVLAASMDAAARTAPPEPVAAED